MAGLVPKKRGRKPKPVASQDDRVAVLERRVRVLENQLRRAEMIIDVQKKISLLLGVPTDSPIECGCRS